MKKKLIAGLLLTSAVTLLATAQFESLAQTLNLANLNASQLPPAITGKFAPGQQPHFLNYVTPQGKTSPSQDNIVQLVIKDEHNATLYNLWYEYDSIHVDLNIDAGTISIPPAIVECGVWWYEKDEEDPDNNLWICSYDTIANAYSTTTPITGTIADDGSITLSPYAFYIPKSKSAESTFSRAYFLPGNATITHQYRRYNGSTYTDIQPAHIIQTKDNMVKIIDFDYYELDVEMALSPDSTVSIAPQTFAAGSGTLSDFTYHPADFTQGTEPQEGNIFGICSPGEITLQSWGLYEIHNPYEPVLGAIKSVIHYDEGAITYPTSAVHDVHTVQPVHDVHTVRYYTPSGHYLGTTRPTHPGFYIEVTPTRSTKVQIK